MRIFILSLIWSLITCAPLTYLFNPVTYSAAWWTIIIGSAVAFNAGLCTFERLVERRKAVSK